MDRQRFENVWDALEDTPAEAANMTLRSRLLIAIEARVRSWNVTQAEAARRLGITQPRLNDLLHGKIANFDVDTLIGLAAAAGLAVRIGSTSKTPREQKRGERGHHYVRIHPISRS